MNNEADAVETENIDGEDEDHGDDNDIDAEHIVQPQLRKSTRVSVRPAYLNDYILLA